jgi:hypothetical protein
MINGVTDSIAEVLSTAFTSSTPSPMSKAIINETNPLLHHS